MAKAIITLLPHSLGKTTLLASTVLLISACSNVKPMYYWGNYENLLYKMYKEPGSATPEVQIERITSDLQRAEANGQKVPPGVYAHLGMMYMANGNIGQAYAAFNEEKTLFPESAILIDGMIKRARENRLKQDLQIQAPQTQNKGSL